MAGGIGEAMLISALTGAGTSAVMGGDPLKGALLGAVTGGVGSAAGGALGGQAATAATQAGTTAGTTAATQAALGADAATSALSAMPPPITPPPVVPGMGAQGLPIPSAAPSSVGATFGQGIGSSMNPYALTSTGMPDIGGSIVTAPPPAGPVVPQTGFTDIFKSTPGGPGLGQRIGNFIVQNPEQAAMISGGFAGMMNPPEMPKRKRYSGPLSRFNYNPDLYRPAFAEGGIMDLPATKRLMGGGHLGSYSDGGRLLKGPGDGMSDDIPAKIGRRQPARLADGEFVVPADVVSGIGNGSTDAGARKLYAMMDKVRQARTGTKKQGREIKSEKYMPA